MSQHGATDFAVVKVEENLTVRWHKCLGGSEADTGCDLVQAKDGGLIVVGETRSNDGNVTSSTQKRHDGWVVKLNRKNLSFFDDRQLIVRFRDGFSRDSALFYQKLYGARQINREKDLSCAGLIQLWQIDAFPVKLPNGEVLNDIVEVANEGVKGNPGESSSDPNYAFSNGINLDSIYVTPQFPTLPSYGSDTANVLKTCERIGRDSATILAIIDSGIDSVKGHALHQKYLWKNLKEGAQGSINDLDGNGFKGDKIGWDFVSDDAFPYDTRGHGSHVTGIIGKMLDTHRGDSVKLMILRIFDAEGNSSLFSLVQALSYAICNNANVVNMSLSYSSDTAKIDKSIIKFLIDFGANRQKMLSVVAAGNNSSDLDAPKVTERYCPAYFNSKNILVVSSINPQRQLSNYSNFGKISADVAAFGDNVFSTFPDNKWGFLTGTSMATPFVSASAALIGTKRCNNPFDFNGVKNALENTVTIVPGLASIRTSGFINFCAARQNFLNTLPLSCLVSAKETPSVLNRFWLNSNPFSGHLIALCESRSSSSDAQLIVSDVLGKTILMQKIQVQTGDNQFVIPLDNAATGVYFITLKIKEEIKTIKAVKE